MRLASQLQSPLGVLPTRVLASSLVALALAACAGEPPEYDPVDERNTYANGQWSCSGTTGRSANPEGSYYVTSFGCWTDASGTTHGDGEDNCIPYCQSGAVAQGRGAEYQALCGGLTGRQCEETVNWYVADSDRYGCMTRLKVTNPANGKAAIVVVLDRGPSCSIERRVNYWVLDASYRVTQYLFGGEMSATERGEVQVEVVPDDTPLGPWTGPATPPPPPPPPTGDVTPDASCNDAASCTVDDDCVCHECASDLWCANPAHCDHDGVCDQYVEGCACSDCATHAACGGAPPPPPPPPPPPSGIWRPTPGTTWQWQLSGALDTSVSAAVYDVDLFETSASQIAALKAAGRKVICYFSAGSYEPGRPDSASFPAAVKGSVMDGWPDERWLDIRSSAVRTIMAARIDTAVSKGCDAVEPDNVDGFDNATGFGLTAAHQVDYNRFLASHAHSRGLSIGLKNAMAIVPQLVGDFDWALNEECFTYQECDAMRPFITAGKAVFHAEYVASSRASAVCAVTRPLGLSTIIKRLDLDAWRVTCP